MNPIVKRNPVEGWDVIDRDTGWNLGNYRTRELARQEVKALRAQEASPPPTDPIMEENHRQISLLGGILDRWRKLVGA